ncbi:hypothetical protein F0562_020137 [Nyssa sinensis]|uniref:Ferric oxidoreductase domain-containing protein n=1 Tax=Nyssa sinensis TaxID=561372 RepID=A0A5J5BQB3_9ASTE|nr:hypothetical protein F0562_020137 [Nyssa sinensis]
MDDLSVHEPFLLNEANGLGYAKKRPFLVPYVKWALKVTIWVNFVVWVSFIFLLPLEYVEDLFEKYLQATSVHVFGVTGSVFILFSGPILIIAFLSIAHLLISGEEEILEKRTPKYPCFQLWTFPVIVDGPFGVVSAAELIGILLFSVYIIWAISVYIVRELSILSKEQLTSKEKRRISSSPPYKYPVWTIQGDLLQGFVAPVSGIISRVLKLYGGGKVQALQILPELSAWQLVY